MAKTRADLFTPASKQIVYFSDFKDDFSIDPLTGDLIILTNQQVIEQSFVNLILRAPLELPYDPAGSISKKTLFESIDGLSSGFLQQTIKETILNYEKRAIVDNVYVNPLPDQSAFQVDINYHMVNIESSFTFSTVLSKVR